MVSTQPLWFFLVSWDDSSKYMESHKKCSRPPTSIWLWWHKPSHATATSQPFSACGGQLDASIRTYIGNWSLGWGNPAGICRQSNGYFSCFLWSFFGSPSLSGKMGKATDCGYISYIMLLYSYIASNFLGSKFASGHIMSYLADVALACSIIPFSVSPRSTGFCAAWLSAALR